MPSNPPMRPKQSTQPIAPPIARRRPKEDTHHGITRVDPYAWLRADNWQEVMRDPSVLDPEIRAYLEAENAYLEAVMAPTKALQQRLFEEMKGRIKEDDSTVPAPDGPWAYYTSFVAGGEYPLICRRPREGGGGGLGAAEEASAGGGDGRRERAVEGVGQSESGGNRGGDGAEVVLLDGNALAEGHAYFSLGAARHSPDHRLIAYATDTKGSEYYTIRIKDIETGALLDDEIPDTAGGIVWALDSRTLFYARIDDNHRPYAVFRHVLGTPASDDALVYEEADPGFFVGVGHTQSHRFIVISSNDHETSEVRLIPAEAPASTPRLVAARERGHEYAVEHADERLIIRTNSDGAEDFRIVEAPTLAPEPQNWREIEPHRPGRLILDVTAYKHHMVRLEREEGLPRIVVRRWSDGAEHAIAFEEAAYSLGLQGGYEHDTTTIRFTYSSMTTPAQVFDYDMEDRTRTLRKTQEVPSGHDPADYETARIMAPAKDGETVPISLLYRKDTPRDGSAPLLLYGYGAYGIAIPAAFSTNRLSLVDRGFIYAIAHIRGGKEKGYRWYREGKREKKPNTFHDFIAAAEHLIAERYTARGRIIAQGGSAGGMLMGAVANMAPALFGGIIAEVPFVDVLTTMLDDTLPLTPMEWPEWGNPITSKDDYELIASYSPYDNVRPEAYPPIIALAGLADPRVTYWEPAKWVARLRAEKIDDNLILLRTNMEAGHGGASGRFRRLEEVALTYAFAIMVSGGELA